MTTAIRFVWSLSISALLVADPALGDELRVRKSIDRLTADELENYAYAVQKLREKSLDDPLVKFSYAHMAGIHNVPEIFGGACEHWNFKFFPWHRALLLNYEDALRAVDAPRTSDITLPYWDWTATPTGKRYPVAFENNAKAAENHYGRVIDPRLLEVLHSESRNADASGPLYPWTEVEKVVTKKGSDDFLGVEHDHGDLENPPHDVMHGFIGGDLVSTATAADDRIFWSFHTYIDLLWWWRQGKVTDSEPCAKCPLNGMEARTAIREDGPTVASDVIDSKRLGYTYEFGPPSAEASMAKAVDLLLSQRFPVLASKSLAQPDSIRQFDVSKPTVPLASIRLSDVQVPTRMAYLAFVYLHPKGVPFDGLSADFRDRYWVGHFGQWANAHHGHASRAVTVDLTDVTAREFVDSKQLVVTVAIHVQAMSREPAPLALDAREKIVDEDSRIGNAFLIGSQRSENRN